MNIISAPEMTSPFRDRHLYPVILCGGQGTRLWPLSRHSFPKQLLPLMSERTLLQETADRARSALGLMPAMILCNEDHRFLISEQLETIGIKPEVIVCEPVGRNTAAALAIAATLLSERDPDAIMLAMPSDHHIGDQEGFAEAVRKATAAASNGWLVTFGIRPTHPHTGYGYIARGAALPEAEGVHAVARFIEKPDLATAERLVADDSNLWNSGIFVLPVATYLEELERHAPEVAAACATSMIRRREQDNLVYPDRESYAACPDISIDYAVMETTDRATVVPADIEWNDVGNWRALRDVKAPDQSGNVLQGDVFAEGVHGSYIRSEGPMVAAIGLDNVVVVATEDAVLVSDASCVEKVGGFVKHLRERKRPESIHHPRVFRPWGYYQTIDDGAGFQVKHIMVKPGQKLSLQFHHHRAEHWVVVGGTGRVTCGEDVQLLHENERIYVPVGATHRLENPGKLPLHLIEVQIGPYLGEDDIVRLEDTYGRT